MNTTLSTPWLKTYFEQQFPYLYSGEENYETFFRYIGEYYGTLSPQYKKIQRAYTVAKMTHKKKRRDTGERYFEHLRGVALIAIIHGGITDDDVICALLLHDISEDFPQLWPISRIALEFNKRIASIVEQVTKPDKALYGNDRFARDQVVNQRQQNMTWEGGVVKLCDVFHNMFTLWTTDPEKKQRKIDQVKHHYLGLARHFHFMRWELIYLMTLHERLPDFQGWPLPHSNE